MTCAYKPKAEEADLTSSLIDLVSESFSQKQSGWHLRNKSHGSSCMHIYTYAHTYTTY